MNYLSCIRNKELYKPIKDIACILEDWTQFESRMGILWTWNNCRGQLCYIFKPHQQTNDVIVVLYTTLYYTYFKILTTTCTTDLKNNVCLS